MWAIVLPVDSRPSITRSPMPISWDDSALGEDEESTGTVAPPGVT